MRDQYGRFTKGHPKPLGAYSFPKGHDIGHSKPGYWKGKTFSMKHRQKLRESHLGKMTGEDNPRWKGGYKKSRGYVLVLQPFHPRCDFHGYVRRSHLIMEKHLRRFLASHEQVHHKNGIKDDDRIENLEFTTNSEHIKHHWRHTPWKFLQGKRLSQQHHP